jgi:hypothetical protein
MALGIQNDDPDRLQIPELPTLEPGISLLETDQDPRFPLNTLAIDELLLNSGTALWLGVGRFGTTDTMLEIAPDRRVLERIHIARGFNPYQHSTLVDSLEEQITPDTAVIVAPELDRRYRDSDLRDGEGQEMLVRSLAKLARLGREHEIPVLVTQATADEFAAPIQAAAQATIEFCETAAGPRFVGEEFETLVYPLENGWVQTTIAFWQEVLKARQPIHGTSTISPGMLARQSN